MLKLKEYGNIGECAWSDVLPNGLKLFVVPKPEYKKSMAFFATNYGGADRRFKLSGQWVDTPAGVAHFLEHKMFDVEGEENALTTLSSRGASANAFTATNMTAYHFECTDMFYENLELLLRFVSTPYFTAESVEKEQGIIAQEIKMVEDEPDYAVYYGLVKSLYSSNPMRDPVAGSVESIREIDPETLYSCHRAFYTPSNMVLVVVGDQSPVRIRDMAGGILPEYNAPRAERDYGPEEAQHPNELHFTREMEVGAPIFLAGVKTVAGLRGREMLRFELISELAMSTLMGRSSPVYSQLYSEGLINDTFYYDFESASGISFISFGGESRSSEQVCLRILDEAERMVSMGIDNTYFERRKKALYGRELRSLNSFDNICYNVAVAGFNDYDYFMTVDVLSSLTVEDVRRFLAMYMKPELLSISTVKEIKR